MNINIIRSDRVYHELLDLPPAERENHFIARVLWPFKDKFQTQNMPLKAKEPGRFDAIRLLGWMHLMPADITEADRPAVAAIADDALWQTCRNTVQTSLALLDAHRPLPVRDYTFTILFGSPKSRMLALNKGYLGDGGIPGYIMMSILPNAYTLPRLQAAIAHECNHNVRFQFAKWSSKTTLADWVVSEGLAESFAAAQFGSRFIGPWVSETDAATLEKIKPVISARLGMTGMAEMTPYLYGDEIAALQGHQPVGLPYAAGYAYGYHLVQAYLAATGKSIVEATFAPTAEILAGAGDFCRAG
ncbi:Zn-dependent protease [Eikenella longinqua]|uniref:Zn-dependent protease n=1 Tax=Eikenella longinqua TaxID=1795827 RepID=A0A1A9S1J7_9NEIS|nr:DUF2268 domain-containing protein [Eikenella longinqua]OAM31251.1 Zn-dependent protease [Eikenella longinqua]